MNQPGGGYPRAVNCDGTLIELRTIERDDLEEVAAFGASLPEADLQFLRLDITDPEVVDRWIASVESGVRFTLLACHAGNIVGYGSLNRRELSWMRHLGEIRVIVAPEHRRCGLGAVLAKEIFEVAKGIGLTRLVAQMAREQQGARRLFHDLGFSVEALLTDWIIDRQGATRDLLVMSYDVTGLGAGP